MPRSFFARFKLSGGIYRPGASLFFLALLYAFAACGGSAASSANSAAQPQASGNQPAATPGAGDSGTSGTPTLPKGTPTPAYLIRSLSVSLVVNQPLDAERQITQDVFAKDPQAQAAGEQINQQSDGSYKVALTFAISAEKYGDIKAYLGTFAADNPTYKGKLMSENETIQNVTTQYVDLQSRLKNLRTEQQRLLQLLSQAQNLSDTLTIQGKLTDVEGQIEQIEGQLNQLNSQTAYSTVTVNLSSNAPPAPAKPAPPKPWSPSDIFSAAASTMISLLQVVVDILIWVAVFAVFWLPALAAFYVWRRLRHRSARPGASGLTMP